MAMEPRNAYPYFDLLFKDVSVQACSSEHKDICEQNRSYPSFQVQNVERTVKVRDTLHL